MRQQLRKHKSRRVLAFTSLAILFGLLASLPQPVDASVVQSYQISASSDDATKYTTNQFSLTRASMDIGLSAGVTYQDNGMRFLNISIDSTYSLYYAKLIFTAYATSSGIKASTIYYEDNVAPATFSTLADFNARTRGGYSQAWTVPELTANTEYDVDVTVLLLSNIGNSSWVSGNNMTFFWTNGAGTTPKRFYSFNGDNAKAVKLEIKHKETFYVTFYYGNYGYPNITTMDDSTPTHFPEDPITSNGSVAPILEGDSFEFWTSMNSSFVFQNYTITGDTAYFDNPLLWTMPENFGNATLWAYSQTLDEASTTMPLGFAPGWLLGILIVLPIGLLLLIKKRH